MSSRILLFILVLGLTPAGPEFVEWVRHYVVEGDFADSADASHRRPPADQGEHGCAVLCHGCGCHGSTGPARELPAVQDINPRLGEPGCAFGSSFACQDPPAPPNPPPIA